MTTILERAFVASSLIAFTACGGGGGTGDMGDDDPVVDTTAPSLVSSSPSSGEAGVGADALLQLVFSEPMDTASVEAALSTSPFQPGEAMLSWNATNDTLTIIPNQPLARAEGVGDDPSVAMAIPHQIIVGIGAKDVAGNHLTGEIVVDFTTEKKMTMTIPPVSATSRVMINTGTIANEGFDLLLGDGANNSYARVLLTFDLAALPAGITGIESASVGARQKSTDGTPYDDLGAIAVKHVIFDTVDIGAFDSTALASMGSMSTNATLETKSADVTAAVLEDYAHFVERDGHTQYRLQFEQTTDNKSDLDMAVFDYTTVGLVVVYTAE